MDENGLCFELPGFRFKPTEEELLSFYLKNMVYDKKMQLDIIGVLNIYKHDPWDLPGLAKIGEREWYFFVPRDRKPSNGGRPNRTTKHGFWKATGSDRKIISLSEPKRLIGLKKTLVFYKGRAPRGTRTDWVMNEYRLPDNCVLHKDIVLCKVYRKATSMKELEERAAKEEAMEKSSTIVSSSTPPPCPTSPFSSSLSNGTTSITSEVFFSTNNNNVGQFEDFFTPNFMPNNDHNETLKIEAIDLKFEETFVSNPYCKVGPFNNNNNNNNNNYSSKQIQEISGQPRNYLGSQPFCDNNNNNNNNNNNTIINSKTNNNNNNGIKLPFGKESLGELQVPKMGVDWAQDPILSLSLSPWIENLLNFSSPTLMSQFLSI